MSQTKFVGWGMVASLAILALVIIFEASMAYGTVENLTIIGGLGIWVFGIWSSVLLLKK